MCFCIVSGQTIQTFTIHHYFDYFELDVLKYLTPSSVINCCEHKFAHFEIPQIVCTGNETNFVNPEMQNIAKKWDFKQVSSTPHHSQGNRKAEAAVKIAKHLIKKAEASGEDICFCFAILAKYNKFNSSLSEWLHARTTRFCVPTSLNKLEPYIIQDASQKIEENRRRSKFYYLAWTRYTSYGDLSFTDLSKQ